MRLLEWFALVALTGCGVRGTPPPGVTCERWAQGSTDSTLAQALSGASAGTCVVAQAGVYRQALSVPQGVTLMSEVGAQVVLAGGNDTQPTLTLAAGSVVAGVTVNASAANIGISGGGRGQRIVQVTVSGGKRAGVVFWCEEDCRTDELSEVTDSHITKASVGLLTRGVRVRLKDGTVSKNGGSGLTTGYGVVASAGALLEIEGTVIEENETLGVLIDGAGQTEATLTRTTVKENKGRGVWAQGITGSMAAPKVKLVDSTIERNSLVGFGVRNSTGVAVSGGRIAATKTGPAPAPEPGEVVMVGDGLGLFENTGDIRVEAAALEANQRSQALVDSARSGIVLTQTVNVAAGQSLGIVVQRTSETVQASNVTRPAAGMELTVSAPQLSVPAR